MSKLALFGGKPVRGPAHPWPSWPMSTQKDAQLASKIVLSNRWSYDGPYETLFAERFTNYTGAKYGLCCANGTVALQLALEALDVGAYDEVIVPGLTWQATAAACIDVNAVPVLADVEPDTWCLDVDKVERAITKRTRAVIVVHLYGCMADMTGLRRLCRKKGLALVEDCAHQPGSFWQGKGVGNLGDMGTFSFQESKVLSSGEGGFVTCRNKKGLEALYSLRNCGRGLNEDMTHALQSGNYRITELQAALLIGGLDRLNGQVEKRDGNAQYLNKKLESIDGVLPMRRRREITQQSYFNFAFRLDPGVFEGVSNLSVCHALNAELSLSGGFEAPYEALNSCSLYKPHTKRRHNLSTAYWKAIDPARFKLPVSEDAHKASGVVIHHAALMGPRRDMDHIARAVSKVVENIEDLRKAGRGGAKGAFQARTRW